LGGRIPKGQRLDDPGVWTDLAHALLNTKELLFLY